MSISPALPRSTSPIHWVSIIHITHESWGIQHSCDKMKLCPVYHYHCRNLPKLEKWGFVPSTLSHLDGLSLMWSTFHKIDVSSLLSNRKWCHLASREGVDGYTHGIYGSKALMLWSEKILTRHQTEPHSPFLRSCLRMAICLAACYHTRPCSYRWIYCAPRQWAWKPTLRPVFRHVYTKERVHGNGAILQRSFKDVHGLTARDWLWWHWQCMVTSSCGKHTMTVHFNPIQCLPLMIHSTTYHVKRCMVNCYAKCNCHQVQIM